MNIFEEVSKLNFPLGNYVVVGSGYLVALGLKKGKDVDIVVTPELFETCYRDSLWERVPWTYPEKIGRIFLRKDLVELYLDVNCGNYNPSTNDLVQRAKIVNGVAFASLEDILRFKKEYSKTKPKHLIDIKIIEDYLDSH